MKSEFTRPDWMPQVPDGMRILVTGATGGLGRAVVAMLADGSDCSSVLMGRLRVSRRRTTRSFP